jgi:hypothetical protein
MQVNPAKHPNVKRDLGQQFIDSLVLGEGQNAIGGYQINGQQLFYPNANDPKDLKAVFALPIRRSSPNWPAGSRCFVGSIPRADNITLRQPTARVCPSKNHHVWDRSFFSTIP